MLNQSGHDVLGGLPAIAGDGTSTDDGHSLSNLCLQWRTAHPQAMRWQRLVIKSSWGLPAVLIKAECRVELLCGPLWAFCRNEPGPDFFGCRHVFGLPQPVIAGGRARQKRAYPVGTIVDSVGDFLCWVLREQGLQCSRGALDYAVEVYPGRIRSREVKFAHAASLPTLIEPRRSSARPTSSRSGCAFPARSARVQESFNTRSTPRWDISPSAK